MGVPVKPMMVELGSAAMRYVPKLLSDGAVRLIYEHVDVVASASALLDALELVDHRDDQPSPIGSQ